MCVLLRSQADMPLIYANEAFARITGYSVAESLGKNCRFLQVSLLGSSNLLDKQCSPGHPDLA